MRPGLQRLQELSERLADVFLVGAGRQQLERRRHAAKDMKKQQRGDRHWDRKGAIGTGAAVSYPERHQGAHDLR